MYLYNVTAVIAFDPGAGGGGGRCVSAGLCTFIKAELRALRSIGILVRKCDKVSKDGYQCKCRLKIGASNSREARDCETTFHFPAADNARCALAKLI